MLVFRVCCKLHNFAIRERDIWFDTYDCTYGGIGEHGRPPMTASQDDEGPTVAPRDRRGNKAMKERRDEWMNALKRAGLARRSRQN